MRRFLAFALPRPAVPVAVGLLVALVGVARPSAAAEPDSVAEVVAGVKSTYQNVKSIKADFTQTVTNPAMGEELHQRGKISLERPRKMRIEVGSPLESAVISDGKTLWVYSVASKSVTATPEIGDGGEIGALLEDLSKLDEIFDIKLVDDRPPKPTQTVNLTPRKAGAFKSLQLSLARTKFTLTDLVLVDQFDSVTSMTFSNLRLNQDVPDSEFVFTAPAGVQLIQSGGK